MGQNPDAGSGGVRSWGCLVVILRPAAAEEGGYEAEVTAGLPKGLRLSAHDTCTYPYAALSRLTEALIELGYEGRIHLEDRSTAGKIRQEVLERWS